MEKSAKLLLASDYGKAFLLLYQRDMVHNGDDDFYPDYKDNSNSASHGLEGEVAIPDPDFTLIFPANLAQKGTYYSEISYNCGAHKDAQ